MIFYFKEFCSLNINSIKFLMSWLNWCHKNVWDWQQDSSVCDVDYESFDSILQIEVRRVKRFQFNTVQMMLEHCVIRKVIIQSFHSCNNILSNSHNRSTKKINDMLMSVKDEKIFSEKVNLSMRIVITSDWRICNSLIASIYWNIFITLTVLLNNWWKDIR